MLGPPVKRLETPWPYSWTTISLSRELSKSGGIFSPEIVPFTVFKSASAIIASPSTSETINIGMVTEAPTAPAPITIGGPATLLTIITATAPSFWAASPLNPNSHSPLLITAIFPLNAPPLVIGSQASLGSVETPESSSSTTTKSSVRGGKGISPPKPAGTPWYTPAKGPLFMVRISTGPAPPPSQINICILGLLPSGGVEKFALFVPEPSCVSAYTPSPSFPGLP